MTLTLTLPLTQTSSPVTTVIIKLKASGASTYTSHITTMTNDQQAYLHFLANIKHSLIIKTIPPSIATRPQNAQMWPM